MKKTFLSFFFLVSTLFCATSTTKNLSQNFVSKITNIDTELAKLVEKSINIHNSLQYWQQEKFYQKLPFYRKTPNYWIANHPDGDLDQHIITLQELDNDFNTSIGMILHLQLLYQTQPTDRTVQDIELLNSLEKTLSIRLKNINQFNSIIQAHQKPSHFALNKWSYATAIGTTTLAWYLHQNMAKTTNQSNKPFALAPFDKPTDLHIPTDLDMHPSSWITWPLQRIITPLVQQLNQVRNHAIENMNDTLNVLNQGINAIIKEYHTKKNQAAIIAGTTIATISLYAGYKQLQNSLYHKPLKKLFHELHDTLNKMKHAKNKNMYLHNGHIYKLSVNIQRYLKMMSNHNLYQINNDLTQLKSLNNDINYKLELINHMYQQYSFLR